MRRNSEASQVKCLTSRIVFFSLALGGGVSIHVENLAASLVEDGHLVWIVTRNGNGYSIYAQNSGQIQIYNDSLSQARVLIDIGQLSPNLIHIHHLIDLEDGFDAWIRASGLPYYITLHDFFYACPRVTLLDYDDAYCNKPTEQICQTCVTRGGGHSRLDQSFAAVSRDIFQWRLKWQRLFASAQKIYAPSEDTREQYQHLMPDVSIVVRPHWGPDKPIIKHAPASEYAPVRVAILGGIGPHKGSRHILSLLRWAEHRAKDLVFVIIGYSDQHIGFSTLSNLINLGPYKPETLGQSLAEANCNVAIFMSICPETYSFTLSEAFFHGLTPVAYDLGAIGQRLRNLEVGVLVPLLATNDEMIMAIREAAKIKITPNTYSEGNYSDVFNSYYTGNLPESITPAQYLPISGIRGEIFEDGWCKDKVTSYFDVRASKGVVVASLYVHPDITDQTISLELNGEVLCQKSLPAGKITHLEVSLGTFTGLAKISLIFSQAKKLPTPDFRVCSANLKDSLLQIVSPKVAKAFRSSRTPLAKLWRKLM